MKQIFLLTILISVTGFSQPLEYGSRGRTYNSDGQKIKSASVRELMKDNPAALKLYNVGRTKKTLGNILFYGGFGLAAINLVNSVYKDPYTVDSHGSYVPNHTYPTLAIIGGVIALASIPIKLGYTKKVKAAINEYNNGIVYNKNIKPDVILLANNQGLGVRIQF